MSETDYFESHTNETIAIPGRACPLVVANDIKCLRIQRRREK
jgi:hypothetical protein